MKESEITEDNIHGSRFEVGPLRIKVISEKMGERWFNPEISIFVDRHFPHHNLPVEIAYIDCETIGEAFIKAARTWEKLDDWKNEKNSEIALASGLTKP